MKFKKETLLAGSPGKTSWPWDILGRGTSPAEKGAARLERPAESLLEGTSAPAFEGDSFIWLALSISVLKALLQCYPILQIYAHIYICYVFESN